MVADDSYDDRTESFENLSSGTCITHYKIINHIGTGGMGEVYLAEDTASIALIEAMLAAGKPVGAVCHAPAVLRHPKNRDGASVVQGKTVTGFTNSEEAAVGLTEIVPFLVEDMLKGSGGNYSKQEDWHPHVVTDGLLITGQNPASSEPAAKALLAKLA